MNIRVSIRLLAVVSSLSASQLYAFSGTVKPGDDIITLTESLQAGDVVEFSDGKYSIPGSLEWRDALGESGRPITLKAASGAKPVIELLEGGGIAYIRDSQFVVVEGLTFTGPDDWQDRRHVGLQIEGSSDITIRNCEIRQTYSTALYLPYTNRNILVEHTSIHDTVDGHGIYIGTWDGSQFGQDSIFKNNWIYNIGNQNGVHVASGSFNLEFSDNVIHAIDGRGIYLSQWTVGAANRIERNAIWSTGAAGIEANGTALVRNNLVFNSGGYGISAYPADEDADAALFLVNNSIANTVKQATYTRLRQATYVLANNAVCNPLGYASRIDDADEDRLPLATVTHNVACGLLEVPDELKAGFVAGGGLDDFQDAENFNFWPSENSHLVDGGNGDAALQVPESDFNGVARATGTLDVGAYERDRDTNPGWVLAEGFKSLEIRDDGGGDVVESGCGSCASTGHRRGVPGELLAIGLVVAGLRRRGRLTRS